MGYRTYIFTFTGFPQTTTKNAGQATPTSDKSSDHEMPRNETDLLFVSMDIGIDFIPKNKTKQKKHVLLSYNKKDLPLLYVKAANF